MHEMKKIIIVLNFFLLAITFAQTYKGTFREIYFYREVSTAAEATGKTYLFKNKDAFSSLYNPSLPSINSNINLSYTNSEKLFEVENANYHSAAINTPFENIWIISASLRLFNAIDEIDDPTIEMPYGVESFNRNPGLIYNINIAREFIRDFHTGVGINYLNYEFYSEKHDFFSLNFGFSYLHTFIISEILGHKVFAGAAINNLLTYSNNNVSRHIVLKGYSTGPANKIYLPQISRFTLGYSTDYKGIKVIKNTNDISACIQLEYFRVLNSNSYKRYCIGTEIRLLEIISSRIGFYSYENPRYITEEFTYGLGLSIPLHLFTAIPLFIGIDYTELGPDSGICNFPDFNSFTINLNYKM